MSTAVIIKKNDRACIAVDTLTRHGVTRETADYVERPSKLVRHQGNCFAVVGHPAWPQALRVLLEREDLDLKWGDIDSIAQSLRRIRGVLQEEYDLSPGLVACENEGPSTFDCLLVNKRGIFGCFALRSVQEYRRFFAIGSGHRIALGAMHAVYEQVDRLREIAKSAMSAAADFDAETCLPFDVVEIALEPGIERRRVR